MTCKRLTPELIQNYHYRYMNGEKLKILAAGCGVDPGTITNHFKKRGFEMKGCYKLSSSQIASLITLYNKGWSGECLAPLFHISDVSVMNYLKQNNIQIRNDYSHLDTDLMADMYWSGMSFRDIGKYFGVYHHVVMYRLRGIVDIKPNRFYFTFDAAIPKRIKLRTCVNCGENFILYDEKGKPIKRYKTCSDKCLHEYLVKFQSGDKSSNWKGGASQGHYQKQSKLHKEMTCEHCGERDVRLDVHHKDKNKSNNNPDNIMILCVSCHAKHHYYNGDSGIQGAP